MKSINDVKPSDVGDFPTGELTILVGKARSGKTMFACKAMLTYLKKYPDKVIGIVSAEETRNDISQRCVSLVGTSPDFADLKEFGRMVFIPGPRRISPKKHGRNRSERDMEYLQKADVLIYDTIYQEKEIPEFVEMFPDKTHVAIYQVHRLGDLSANESPKSGQSNVG